MTFKKRERRCARRLGSWLGEVAAKALHRIKLDRNNGFIAAARLDRPEHHSEVPLSELVVAVLASPLVRYIRRLTLRGEVDDIVEAIPETPPPVLQRLELLTPRWAWASLSGAHHSLDLRVDAYRTHGIEVRKGDYGEDDRYVAPRE